MVCVVTGTAVYGTGMLEFTLALAVVFAIGIYCGVLTCFLLLSLLRKYKQVGGLCCC